MPQQQSVQTNLSIHLPDGRRLGYAEYGVAQGKPVLFFHGAPGSSHIHADMAEIAAQQGVRLIAIDRPGYGFSDLKHGRTMLDWSNDIAALADALRLEKFALVGFSIGSPYPLACAYRLAHRISKIALVATLAPLDAPGVTKNMSPAVIGLYELARTNPEELRNTLAAVAPSPAALVAAMPSFVSEWDGAVLHERQAELETEYAETLRQGVEGIAVDYELYSKNWGFPLDGIQTETHLWCGTLDVNAPPAMTAYIASQLPNSSVHMLQNEGHFVLYGHWEDILKSVA